MRTFLTIIGVLLVGYVAGAVAGYVAVEYLSQNTHDRSVEAAMTGAFVSGPAGALLAALIWLLRRSLGRRAA